jgi:hypothetical protein
MSESRVLSRPCPAQGKAHARARLYFRQSRAAPPHRDGRELAIRRPDIVVPSVEVGAAVAPRESNQIPQTETTARFRLGLTARPAATECAISSGSARQNVGAMVATPPADDPTLRVADVADPVAESAE